jgi:serine/threonine protein kinase
VERVLAGRYELEFPLGRGGSGEVWRGRDMATRRPVAIKVVELANIDDPGLLAETIGRFRREATVIAGLRHPNIVGSLDAGRVGNQLFMVMDLAPGISLASMMDERGERGMGLFPVSSVLRIAEEVSLGLGAAHEAGVVHRDVKPSNLMATPQLSVKIIDFGIARLLTDNSPRLTMRGHTVGTVAYMSPEQAQGEEVDGRADLYSLGCVLYELLSGRLPFRSALPSALLMMQVMDQAIPLSALRPDLPAGLPELVSDLMEKDRAARPSDAGQVISRITAIDVGLGSDQLQHEADRQTVQPGGAAGVVAETRHQEIVPRSSLQAVFTPERRGAPPGQETEAVPPWEMPAQPSRDPHAQQVPDAAWDPPPPSGGNGSSAPPSGARSPANGAFPASGGGIPSWPAPPPRRPRRRWRAALSSLLTVALAVGVWVYVWERSHDKLVISTVKVTTGKRVGCDGTEEVIGLIGTNGHAGPITYQWVGTAPNLPVHQAEAGDGSDTVKVSLAWAFHGKGIGQEVVTLRVLTPATANITIELPYRCPK